MLRPHLLIALTTGIAAIALAPLARADEPVTYEVISSYISVVNIEYNDLGQRQAVQQVALPWRMNATVGKADSNDAEIRVDWRPQAGPGRWLTVRIFSHGSLLCESILDVGNATCYGGTSHTSHTS